MIDPPLLPACLAAAAILTELDDVRFSNAITGAVPEPVTWAMMIFGCGAIGYAARRRPSSRGLATFG